MNNKLIDERIDESVKELKENVDYAIEDMLKNIQSQQMVGQRSTQHRIEIAFLTTSSYFFSKEQVWEKWILQFRVVSMNDYNEELLNRKIAVMIDNVEKRMKQILIRAHANVDHLPSILDTHLTFGGCYPFKV